ncbi:metallophosphoesterase [Methylophilus sp. TWE2]|uniref:metallophosphoesterase family protein n=1 Tax=Methylophilus sp. TWE2 TaxID=1662285 RepID=UPI00067159F6|nr:YfcE family phosphodiesterase [Methylophilus sp. TWE2]AKR43491.1 hypothetical protein ACJ67_08690 [Methylophilus sp. TWE2]
MKLGLMGDIHANDHALEVVLAAAKSNAVSHLLITGDLVGYYYHPAKVLALLKDWENKYIVLGNHEVMLKQARADLSYLQRITQRYGHGLQLALEALTFQQLDELCNLPHPQPINISGRNILLCHGSPWDNDIYIYPDTDLQIFDGFKVEDFDLIVLGHTHYPMSKMIGNTLVVNPGSVGQPRNRQPGAQWAIYDTDTNTVEFRCEAYDPTYLIHECIKNDPELPYLHEVLTRT